MRRKVAKTYTVEKIRKPLAVLFMPIPVGSTPLPEPPSTPGPLMPLLDDMGAAVAKEKFSLGAADDHGPSRYPHIPLSLRRHILLNPWIISQTMLFIEDAVAMERRCRAWCGNSRVLQVPLTLNLTRLIMCHVLPKKSPTNTACQGK